MAERTTRAILFVIAVGLWANVATQWLRPATVEAQGVSEIVLGLGAIQSAITGMNVDLLTIGKDVSSIDANVESMRKTIR